MDSLYSDEPYEKMLGSCSNKFLHNEAYVFHLLVLQNKVHVHHLMQFMTNNHMTQKFISQVFQYLSCKYFEYLFHHRLDINRPFVVWRDLPPSFLVLNPKRLFESNSRLSSRLKLGKCNDRVRCNFTIIVRRFWWLFKHFYLNHI